MKKNKAESYSAPVSPGENAQFQVNITDADTGSKIATTKIERRTARCRRRRSIFTLTCLFCSLYFHFFFLSLYLFVFFPTFFCLLEKANERPSSINNEQITEEETSSANTTSLSLSLLLFPVSFSIYTTAIQFT